MTTEDRHQSAPRMQAIVQDRYGSPDVLRLDQVERPSPSAGQVLIAVHAAGVDPGVWHYMTGRPLLARLAFGLRAPKLRVRGWDVAGTVTEVGADVTDLAVGDRVYGYAAGSYAEYAVLDARLAAPIPQVLTFADAAAMPVSAATALLAVRDIGEVADGQRVMVLGAGGGIGHFVVQLAAARGAHVTAVCGGEKDSLVREMGAHDVIDYTREDPTDGSRSYDVIIDTAGRRPIRQLRRALAKNGVVAIVGGEGGGALLGGFQRQIFAPVLTTFGNGAIRAVSHKERRQDLLDLNELVDAGTLRPHVGRSFPLAEAPDAIRHLAEGHSVGKSVVVVRDCARGNARTRDTG